MAAIAPSSLPVDAVRADFDVASAHTAPIVLVAPTGSGKSTRLPGWMLDGGAASVLVVEPRRVACRSLAGFVAQQRGVKLGEEVGYRVRFDDQSSATTKILFVTPGIALRMLARFSASELETTAILVDEFHERGWEVDLLVTTLLQRQAPKLVLTSATVDADALAGRIGATVMRAEGRTYPIDVSYADAPLGPTKVDLEDRVAEAVGEMLREHSGDALVFLPGQGEITRCAARLASVVAGNVEIQPLHGRLSPQEMARALKPASDGHRRVTLATNVAETSLTLPNVRIVIDSGLMRATVHRGGRMALALVAAPQSSLDQRAGRAGRIAPGHCRRLFSARFQAPPFATPEVERMELDDVLLQAAALGLEGTEVETAPWPTPPPAFAVQRARDRLTAAGALAPSGARTSVGEAWSQLPVASEVAALLHGVDDAEMRGILADVVAVTEREGSLFLPVRDPEDAAVSARAELLKGVSHEVEANVWALRAGHEKTHRLHRIRLSEARKLAFRLRSIVGAEAIQPTDAAARPRIADAVALAIACRRPLSAFVRRPRADRKTRGGVGDAEPWGNGVDEVWVHRWDTTALGIRQADDVQAPKKIEAGVILSTRWVAKTEGRGVRGFGEMVIPCRLTTLADAKVGTASVAVPTLAKRKGRTPVVKGIVRRELGGVVLEEEERALNGRPLIEAMAGLVLEGRLFPETGEQVVASLHTWKMAAALGDTVNPAPDVTPLEWVIKRLTGLGVESNDDIALLTEEDFALSLSKLAGVDLQDERRLREDFPPTWTHQGATYGVTFDVKRKVVRLVAEGKKAMKAADPPVSVVPRFRGMPVEIQRASRVKRLR